MSWLDDGIHSIVRRALGPQLDRISAALGRRESRRVRTEQYVALRDAEFQVFSQWGEDGIIQYLIGRVPIAQPAFVEFGVEDYSESNTRFLLCNDNWRGLIIDAGTGHQRFVAQRGLDWRYDLTAVSSFVTRENIDDLLRSAGFEGDIGLLSIDIDGNDYWIMEAIRAVSPRILVVEYNASFGCEHPVTIPYRPDFRRRRAHASNLYYGASLPALCDLAARKGYSFVGCNSAGNNAFFVRADVAGGLRTLTAQEGFVMSRFRESRDAAGRISLVSSVPARVALMADMEVVRVPGGTRHRVGDLLGTKQAGRA